MGLKIKERSFGDGRDLELSPEGVAFRSTGALSGKKHKYKFHEIEYILMSRDSRLAFGAGGEVYHIKIDPDNAKHKEIIGTMVREARRTAGG